MNTISNDPYGVTFLVPIFNAEKYLREALQSICDQTIENFKVLMIDDYSTDSTVDIAKSFLKDPRFKIVHNSGEKGLVSCLNFGLSQIDTPWVARFDSDDVCLPDRLREQIDYLRAHPDIVVLGTHFQMFGDMGITNIVKHPEHPVEVAWKFCWNTRLGHPTVMFKKDVILEFGGYPHKRAEDFFLFSKISKTYSVGNVPQILLKYRWHGENKSFLERQDIGREVYEVCSTSLEYFGVPSYLHEDFVTFHWGHRVRAARAVKSLYWSIRIYFKVLSGCESSRRISGFCFVFPKVLATLMYYSTLQLKYRLLKFRNVLLKS